MNKEETLALYSQGKEAWNTWAKKMLDKRNDSPEWRDAAGASFVSHALHDADFSGFVFPGYALFIGTTFMGAARFDKARFLSGAKFQEVAFKGPVYFEHAVFEGTAEFEEMTFKGPVYFERVTFKGRSQLNKATFEGAVDFWCARFENEAVFEEATFKEYASFGEARFKNLAAFYQATFKSNAMFTSAAFKGTAEFRGATFEVVAAFGRTRFENEADFEEVAFDGTALFWEVIFEGTARFGLSTFEHSTNFYGAKFRAEADFKAVQGNSVFTMADAEFIEVPDFQQATFVQAPRLDNVKIGPQLTRWDKLKAFFIKGESERPGRWRALRRLATQGHDHASERRFFKEEVLARRGITDKWYHASFWFGIFYQLLSNFGLSLSRPLIAWFIVLLGFAYAYGSDGPWQAAFLLSLHKSLPALSSFSGGLPGVYARLYGVASCDPFRPIIPDSVIVLGIIQTLFSVVMIFLFLLAVRNHFRIK